MFLLILIALIIVLVVLNVRIVPQAESYVIERLGKYKCTWTAGIHIKVPFIECIARKVSLKEQVSWSYCKIMAIGTPLTMCEFFQIIEILVWLFLISYDQELAVIPESTGVAAARASTPC